MTDDTMAEELCAHGKGENIHPPIYWNPFNQVYQCHKCGEVFVPNEQIAALVEERNKLQARNAELSELPDQMSEQIADLEKRNEELEGMMQSASPMNEIIFALESKLKTAEEALADWKSNAHRFGETMSTVGPNGYYEFTPDQWFDWMVKTRKEQWKERP